MNLQPLKTAARDLSGLNNQRRNDVLRAIAAGLNERCAEIIVENELDMSNAADLSPAMKDRLFLDEARINAMAQGVLEIAALPDPIGEILEGSQTKDGLIIQKVSVPIGVIGAIYEARPNVTIDIAALCIKSGNACVLKGGSEAINSNRILAAIVAEALEKNGAPKDAVHFIDSTDREATRELLKQNDVVDLIIPRGGAGLIDFVVQNSTIPVIKHDKGVCHIFVDKFSDCDRAIEIILNAKVQKPSACNALETLLVHRDIKEEFLPRLARALSGAGVELRACDEARDIITATPASDEDWSAEYLDKTLALKVVKDLNAAVAHINLYGSGHSDAILTTNYANSQKFLKEVDSACVYVNASTRFTDGFAFGLGAEVGISTGKLHCRGPMGLKGLMTYKYKIYGSGQIRS